MYVIITHAGQDRLVINQRKCHFYLRLGFNILKVEHFDEFF